MISRLANLDDLNESQWKRIDPFLVLTFTKIDTLASLNNLLGGKVAYNSALIKDQEYRSQVKGILISCLLIKGTKLNSQSIDFIVFNESPILIPFLDLKISKNNDLQTLIKKKDDLLKIPLQHIFFLWESDSN